MMYQIFILNLPTTKRILFTTKIIIFRIYSKENMPKQTQRQLSLHCYTTFVTKNKFLLKHFRSFFYYFASFVLSVFLSQIYFYIHFRRHQWQYHIPNWAVVSYRILRGPIYNSRNIFILKNILCS
jgi:hypothetical protein